MSARTIGHLLTEFDPNGRVKAHDRIVPFERKLQSVAAQAEEVARKTIEAYQRGTSDGHAGALTEYENKLAEEKVRYTVKLAQERERWSKEQSSIIAQGVSDACRELEANIASVVARILEPFLAGAIRREAIAALVDHLSVLASDPSRPVLRISGPGDLLDAIQKKVGTPYAAVEYCVADTAEVRVLADQTVIETQMRSWRDRLAETIR